LGAAALPFPYLKTKKIWFYTLQGGAGLARRTYSLLDNYVRTDTISAPPLDKLLFVSYPSLMPTCPICGQSVTVSKVWQSGPSEKFVLVSHIRPYRDGFEICSGSDRYYPEASLEKTSSHEQKAFAS